jgi:hypothetical protein
MIKYDKIIRQILDGLSDAKINFNDVRNLPINLGFEERIKGSHHFYKKSGIAERIIL